MEDLTVHRYGNRDLSKRERRVITLVAKGMKNRDIAQSLGTTEAVIKNYLRRIYDKIGVWNRVELALWHEARRHADRKMHSPHKVIAAVRNRKNILGINQQKSPHLKDAALDIPKDKSA